MSRPVTLKDVAREAGLSIAAASHALNGSSGVSEATRHRVIEISESLGYRPRARRAARGGGALSMRLVIVGGRSAVHYFNHWVSAITRVAQQHNIRLDLRHIESESPEWEAELRQHACGVDGLLIHGYIWKALARVIEHLRVPVVVAGDAEPGPGSPRHQVSLDAWGMAAFATRTLLAAGHRRIGFVCPEFPPGGWFDQWLSGYQLTMLRSEAGYDPQLARVLKVDGHSDPGIEAAKYMAALADPPTAYIVPQVGRAASFRQAMAAHGIELGPESLVMGGEVGLLRGHGLSGYPILTENAEDCAAHALQWLSQLAQGESVRGRLTVSFRAENFDRLTPRASASGHNE